MITEPHAQTEPRTLDERAAAPPALFVSGRQHSGNTVTVCIFEMVPECLTVNVEGKFFEQRQIVERIRGPEARANRLVDLLRFEDRDLAERTRAHLVAWHEAHAGARAIDVYREAMRFATETTGKKSWVRRATSYIFYAEEILELMPEAKVLYLVRNPYDVCASKKRRAPRKDRYWGWVTSWNRGLKIATELQRRFPERFMIVRYEDMVSDPTGIFQAIFGFAGVPFEERYLDVPHVNRSEAKQTRTSETRGLSPSRIYYYTGILSPTELAVVDRLVWKERLLEHYPNLPHWGRRHPWGARVRALGIAFLSPLAYGFRQVRAIFGKDPAWRVRRLLRRAKIVVRSD